MNEQLYIPADNYPFKIKFRDNIKPSNKKMTFFHAIKFFSRIYTEGGKWYHTSFFLSFQLFIFFPIAIIFDLIILILTGILYGSGLLVFYFLKKIIKWLGVPITIALGIIVIFILGVIIYYHFSELTELINNLFNKFYGNKI